MFILLWFAVGLLLLLSLHGAGKAGISHNISKTNERRIRSLTEWRDSHRLESLYIKYCEYCKHESVVRSACPGSFIDNVGFQCLVCGRLDSKHHPGEVAEPVEWPSITSGDTRIMSSEFCIKSNVCQTCNHTLDEGACECDECFFCTTCGRCNSCGKNRRLYKAKVRPKPAKKTPAPNSFDL